MGVLQLAYSYNLSLVYITTLIQCCVLSAANMLVIQLIVSCVDTDGGLKPLILLLHVALAIWAV